MNALVAVQALAVLLFAVGSIGNALAHAFGAVVACRLLGGIAIGFALEFSPMPEHLEREFIGVGASSATSAMPHAVFS